MFTIDNWKEIFLIIKQYKLRTFLTGFGVFWGIFMLLILLGTGAGLKKGIYNQFSGYATNSFFIWGGKTSLPYQGMNPGRHVRLSNSDLKIIKESIQTIKNINASTGLEGEYAINYQKNSGSFPIIGNLPDLNEIEKVDIINGRFLNELDCERQRKVVVIGLRVKDVLFGSNDPIGKNINIRGVFFKVVGVFNKTSRGNSSRDPTSVLYMPLPTLQRTFNMADQVQWIGIRVQNDQSAIKAEKKTKELLRRRHKVSPMDRRGIGSWNTIEKFNKTVKLFQGINAFIWIVGIGTLTAGIVGVSNIMLIIVNERTREIGIRKTIGATPLSIISLILKESLIITLVFGYIGLVAGVFTIESAGSIMTKLQIQSDFFHNPEINLKAAIFALVLLVIAGVVAGLVPAYRAASINPIESLRSE